ncbi:MAG: hypothetical protein Q9198_005822 [Flavoplaca austrocitrina]
MAFIHSNQIEWHHGEASIQKMLHVPYQDNPTSPFLSPHAALLLPHVSLLALGTLDDAGRPWTTLLGGAPGFITSVGQSSVGIKTPVDPLYDPVINILLNGKYQGEKVNQGEMTRIVSGLGIHLATRSRVKLAGKLVAGALDRISMQNCGEMAELQLVIKVEQSLGIECVKR